MNAPAKPLSGEPHARFNGATTCEAGKRTEMVVPTPSELSTSTAPPCSSTSRLVSGKPSPVPSGLFGCGAFTWANGPKIRVDQPARFPNRCPSRR